MYDCIIIIYRYAHYTAIARYGPRVTEFSDKFTRGLLYRYKYHIYVDIIGIGDLVPAFGRELQ
jgi:hypothetical protein